jgi:hypothetical protein
MTPVPSSWNSVATLLLVVVGYAAIIVISANVVGHVKPKLRGVNICWFAQEYVWPFGEERYTCVATVPR